MMLKANAGCAARAHVTRASAIRAHAQRLPLAVIVFLLVLFAVNTAYADDWYSVLYDSHLDSSDQYIVSASNRYDAAAFICGKSKSDVDSFTLEQRAKLSLNGGRFQELAESLDDVWPWWNDENLYYALENTFGENLMSNMTLAFGANLEYPYVHFNPDALSVTTIDYWQSNCPTKIFACNVSPQLVANARTDLQTILNGGTLPTTGPNTFTGFPLTVTCKKGNWTANRPSTYVSYWFYVNGTKVYPSMVDDVTLTLDYNGQTDLPTGDYDVFVCLTATDQTSNTICFCKVAVVPKDSCELQVTNGKSSVVNVSGGTITEYLFTYYGSDAISTNNTGSATSNNTFSWTVSKFTSSGISNGSSLFGEDGTRPRWFSQGVGSSGGDEPNPWPTPVPPEQPNVPEPPDVSPPPIGGPVFPTNPPEDPTTTTEPEPTGTDYTVYLKAIIRQLNQVMVQMSNHCKHIRDQISTSANAIISNMHTYIEDLQESIDSNFSALNDYLEDLTKWYEQFTNDVISDLEDELSTIQSILRQILRKIGVSRGTPKEVEKEVDDDFNFLEWLINFITSKLAGVIDEFVGDVGSLIEGVKDKFPFSIPWDIMGILALLDGVRATPRFEITLPAVSGWWQQTTFVIDLSPFDSVASAVRIMINAWWVLVLALKTNWMLMIMGDSTSLGERIANRISGSGD